MEDGAFYLEDLDDKVELDLTQAVRLSSDSSELCQADLSVFAEPGIWIVHGGIVRAGGWRLYSRLDVLGE